MTPEHKRLQALYQSQEKWHLWGPYLSERQWGTVREDYSPYGNAWEYFPHEMARSRAYRWGEDGLCGISCDQQRLCFGLALWNEQDAFLKERLYGVTNAQGNHGEDVKEYYYYLDATPTHSYLKMLYKYPQTAYPYQDLVEKNLIRANSLPEYELIDTGILTENRYFDVFVEYAKADTDDIYIKITAYNHGPETKPLHVIPQLWFRNTWTWFDKEKDCKLTSLDENTIAITHKAFKNYKLYLENPAELLFCENETNVQKLFGVYKAGYCKDGIHDYIVHNQKDVVNPYQAGTKAGAHYKYEIPAGESITVRLRLTNKTEEHPFAIFNKVFEQRITEADLFYAEIQRNLEDEDACLIQRQAFAGLIFSKQFYYLDIPQWIKGDPAMPSPPHGRCYGRNSGWLHLNNADIISMPDKWEYPWYAAWDLAFHCLPFALIDIAFAKQQLLLLTREWYMHPNGQLPAYEWNFEDVNPPVHAWATWRIYQMDKEINQKQDLAFLERIFHKLMLNFTWWVNRKDREDRNIFQGGFLGLDNIGVFDRSRPLPTGGYIDQADATSWMAMYCLNLMRIALELAVHNPVYQDIATKFFEHFLHIAEAMNNIGNQGLGLWDEEDGFYYDVLNLSDNQKVKLKVRSMVGLIPLFAIEILEPELLEKTPEFKKRLEWYMRYKPELASLVACWETEGKGARRLVSLVSQKRLAKILYYMLDENEFLSDYGIRSLSKFHQDNPYTFHCEKNAQYVDYQPGESLSRLFGGNSNWRGPIWFPVNFLLIEALHQYYDYYGEDFTLEYPSKSGNFFNLKQIADKISQRLVNIFLKDQQGNRPVFNQYPYMNQDLHFKDYILFFEYFHGDNGRGLGASHQTGWTALIAKLLQQGFKP